VTSHFTGTTEVQGMNTHNLDFSAIGRM